MGRKVILQTDDEIAIHKAIVHYESEVKSGKAYATELVNGLKIAEAKLMKFNTLLRFMLTDEK